MEAQLTSEQLRQQVWQMFRENEARNERENKEIREIQKQYSIESAKTDAKIKKLEQLYSSLGINIGESAEMYFFSALSNRSSLCGIEYEHVDSFHRKTKHIEGQYDVVLFNGDKIIVVEVKQKVHSNDITDFLERRLPKFKLVCPEFAHKQIIGAIAGMVIPFDVKEEAEQKGLIVLTQLGNDVEVLNKPDFTPTLF